MDEVYVVIQHRFNRSSQIEGIYSTIEEANNRLETIATKEYDYKNANEMIKREEGGRLV